MGHTVIQGQGWLKANPSALGTGVWIKTSEHGVVLDADDLSAFIQALLDMEADLPS